MGDASRKFVSRAGEKLAHALTALAVDVRDLVCADFGCNVGGFTDCLLRHGAARIYAIDTGYGVLAYTLRTNAHVVVMERTNVLHASPPAPAVPPARVPDPDAPPPPDAIDPSFAPSPSPGAGGVDLVVIDLAWTPQRHAIPAALRWLNEGGRILSLIKPHYELSASEKQPPHFVDGRLDPSAAEDVLKRVLGAMPSLGAHPVAHTRSPLTGGKSARGVGGRGGNVEFFALLTAGVER